MNYLNSVLYWLYSLCLHSLLCIQQAPLVNCYIKHPMNFFHAFLVKGKKNYIAVLVLTENLIVYIYNVYALVMSPSFLQAAKILLQVPDS